MGPLTEDLHVPNDLDLYDRPAALEQLDVSAAADSRLVNVTKDYIGSGRETAQLASTSRPRRTAAECCWLAQSERDQRAAIPPA
ncbi:hypothetical protein ACIA6C_15540 [Streptomyces sp. NPDC051578]|uniref:hypothetical protein n=1 Tax=Streptomyces sp. NPDC051578 TaxID=3365662 RepID=UPI00379AEDA9